MAPFAKDKLEGFDSPQSLPRDPGQSFDWQAANRRWWEEFPLRYDWKRAIRYREFSKEFYAEIDKRFFADVKAYLPYREIPFDSLLDFNLLRDKKVLEIGVGLGSMAMLFARYARSFTGIDITDYAVKSTRERMRVFGLEAQILRMDAEELEFPDESFDFIWAWGVIHHSCDTGQALCQMCRVLKPGGRVITMVYRRGFWNYYLIGILRAILQGGFLRGESLHKIMQQATDGALARFYSLSEWQALASRLFLIERTLILGRKTDIIILPSGKIKDSLIRIMPDSLARFLGNRLKMGGLLVSLLRKAL